MLQAYCIVLCGSLRPGSHEGTPKSVSSFEARPNAVSIPGKLRVEILAESPVMFCGFPQFLQAYAELGLKLGHGNFHPRPPHFIIH